MSFQERRVQYARDSIIVNQQTFVAAGIAKIEEAAPSGGGLEHEEPGETVNSDVNIEKNDEDKDLNGVMTVEIVEARWLRGRIHALQERRLFNRVEDLAAILTAIALAEISLDLERRVTNRDQTPVEVGRKL